MNDYDFTSDWFSGNIPNWKRFLVPALSGKPVRWLELGSYEGRSAVWTLENLLTHSHALLICVDHWHSKDCEDRFDRNIVKANGRGKLIKRKSDWLPALLALSGSFDGVYIDADHLASNVMTQACVIWQFLAPGAFMVFDDYLWLPPSEVPNVTMKDGIDAFLSAWAGRYVMIHKGYQVIIQKLS